ncbi:MAG: rhodanese-like domain-containing protein [Clostridia bacterium]|nr:rhodanese-like domain-containing protein [Clostridia bacterium]
MKKTSLIGIIVVLVIVGFFFYNQQRVTPAGSEGYVKYSPAQLEERLDTGEQPVLVDVRFGYEFATGHITGAINIPLGQLKDRVKELSKEKEIIFVCHDGPMGDMAANYLLEQGYTKVGNLVGGMGAWSGPLVK